VYILWQQYEGRIFMLKDILTSEWHKTKVENSAALLPIDVRSPIEFIEGHIPNAINIPLFTDEERSLIGITYKQEGQQAAKWKAMEIVSPKIPALLEEINKLTVQGTKPLLYCWRGGSRSAAFATFAELAGLNVIRLKGGYKAYRSWCVEQLNTELVKDKLPVILHGMTGVGKTEILHQLALQHPTLDLEKIANHRGSVFGQIGIKRAHNQKTFESLLLDRLFSLDEANYIILEAESRRIGKVSLPDFLMSWRKEGIHFILKPPLTFRIEVIMNEYVHPFGQTEEDRETLALKAKQAFDLIQKRLSPEERQHAEIMLQKREYASFIELLLVKYYDTRYQFHKDDYTGKHIEITYETVEEAANKIHEHIERLNLVSMV
jgi:tRNA 2-selenouridine synthase